MRPGPPVSGNPQPGISKPDIARSLEREIRRGVGEVLATRGKHADDLRSDIAMVMREIDAGGTVFRAAIEAGDEKLEHEVLAAFEALSAEYGDMAFMLADLARAAGEIQDSLEGQGRELRAASEQVGRQSADARMIREELAVIERRTSQWLPEAADPGSRWAGGCPYRGLLPYDQAHAAVFHGRERLTAELAGKLAGAGQVFTADGPDGRLERASFIDAVCAAAAHPTGARGEPPARVVIAVRGDYWDRCASYPQLVRAMEHDQLVVGPMQETGLRRVITGPAEVSGLHVDSALIDAILADVGAADIGPGGAVLPMLSQALMLTWEKRDGDRLTREGYDGAGGVARAVEVSAEAVYTGLPADQQAIARDMLRRMTAMGHDRRPVRRPVSRAELRADRPKNQWAVVGAVLDAFAGNRLMMLGADSAEITHDVVLQAWPRLRDWLGRRGARADVHRRRQDPGDS